MSRNKVIIFSLIIGGGLVFVLTWLVWPVAKQNYVSWRFNNNLHGFVNALQEAKKADYAAAMADTYGGKTPQETLQMYIDAVEKGDYELASKYFIGGNQEKELNKSKNATEEVKNKYISILIKSILLGGKYSETKDYFSFNGSLLISLKLYPNGIWKIIEI